MFLFKKYTYQFFLIGLLFFIGQANMLLAQCPGKTIVLNASFTNFCGSGAPINVTLTNNSTGGPFSGIFELFQDGNSIGNPLAGGSIVATITGLGSDTFMLTYDQGPCQDTSWVAVNYATGSVVADFALSQTTICSGQSSTFTNTSTGTITNYAWTFGNGNTSNTAGPHTQTYNTPGNINVQLSVTGACGTDTEIKVLTVTAGSSVAYTTINDSFCVSNSVAFTNTSTAGGPFTWSFGDGGTSTASNPTHIYTTPGTYPVILSTTAPGVCTDSVTANIVIKDTIHLSFSGNDGDGDTRNCLPYNSATTTNAVTFTNNSTGATSYTWNFGDGSPAITTVLPAAVSHTYNSYGVFNVILTANNGVCNESDTIEVVFGKNPKAIMSVPGPTSGCAPLSVTPINQSLNGETYIWDFGDAHIDTITTFPAPTNMYEGGGYTISLTVINFCDTDQTSFAPIIVAPTPSCEFTTNTGTGCVPQLVQFTNITTNYSPINNFQWYFGDGTSQLNVPFNTAVTHTYTTADTFTVMLIAGNVCGKDTFMQDVIIYDKPHAGFSVNPSSGCMPPTLTINNLTTGRNPTYQWFVNGVLTSTADTLASTFLNPSIFTYVIKLVASNTCGFDDTTITVTYSAPTIANFTISNNTLCTGSGTTFTSMSSGTNLSYEWNFGNGNTSILPGPHTQNYTAAGTPNIMLIVNGDCGADTIIKNITVYAYPVSAFTASDYTICKGESITFNNTSTPTATSFWSFQNATPAFSTAYNPGSIVFNLAGSQVITLNTGQNGCISTHDTIIVVYNKPTPNFATTPSSGCSPITTVFTNLTTNTPGNIYAWNFDNGNTSSAYNPPSQTYINASQLVDSTFSVELIVTSIDGCQDSITKNIDVRPVPLASFTQDLDTACALDPVQFTNTTLGAIAYNWNFDDGTSSTSTNPAHLFPSFGIYDVVMIATNAYGCKDTAYQSIVVDSVPTVDFSFADVCFGQTTSFTNLSSGGSIWDWQFGDGNSDVTLNTSHIYATTGNFTVTLIGLNPGGCGDTMQKTIFISPIPIADFNYVNLCETQTTNFTDISTGYPILWTWNFGDVSTGSGVQNPNHVFASDGNYTVELAVENTYGCRDTMQHIIYIDSIPTTDFTALNACMNDSILFTNTTIFSADTFLWNFADGTMSGTETLNHAYTTAGNYNVMLVAGYTQSLCFDTSIHAVTIYQRSIPDFTYDSACFGLSTPFYDATLQAPTNWTWNFGDGNTSTGIQNPTHSYAAAGSYNVTLTTSTADGCTDSIVKPIFVKPKPTAGFTNDSACFGNPIHVQDTSQVTITSWLWNMGNFATLAGTQTFNYTYSDTGSYTIQLIVTNNYGCKDTALQNTFVYPIPNADFNFDTACFAQMTSFTDLSDNPMNWYWEFNDGSGATSFSQNPTHVFAAEGIFPVELFVENGFSCKDSATHYVTVVEKPFSGFYLNSVCAYDSSFFIDTTLNNPVTWEWNFGDGSASEFTQNPSHVYASGGNYNVTLITSNANGCYDTLVRIITAYTTPTANFTVDTACLGDITHFTNLSTDIYPITWSEWDFGDGNNSYAFSPDYIYQDSGMFTVSLLLINDKGCDTTIQKQINVKFTPTAEFTFDTVCLGNVTSFSSTTAGGVGSWIWNFGDGIIDTTTTPNTTHLYASGGSYIVTLETALQGCSDVTFGIVEVVSDVVAQIYFDSMGYCLGEAIMFKDSSQTGSGVISNIFWDFDDGTTSTLQNPTHLYSDTGNYQVMLAIATTQGCVDTAYATVPLFINPTAGFFLSTSSACQGHAIQFTDTSSIITGYIANYTWNFGNGNTANTANSDNMYSNIGTYVVSLVVSSDNGCTDTAYQSLNILNSPLADFGYTATCSNDTTTFTDLSSYGGGYILDWHWDFGDNDSSALQNPTHWYNLTQDSITATLVVTADNGCTDEVQKTIYFFAPPILDFRAINAEGCAPFTASFEDNSYTNIASSITNWFWDFGDGTYSFDENPAHTYRETGNYNVVLTLTNSFGCSISDTLIYPIIIHTGPTTGFETNPAGETTIINPTVHFIDLSLDADYLMWIVDGVDSIGNDSSVQYTFADTGWHQVTQWLVNNYGCESTLTKDIYIKPEFTFFVPNTFSPNKNGPNEVFIGQGIGIRSVRMVIYDREGHEVFESYDKQTGWKGQAINGDPVPQDTYVYQIYVTDIFGDEHYYMGSITVIR